ncbi:MAG: anhydro-N-acetylmuramic acid kinase [Gammaproteobacteria bacterium]|nr:anhydro-N-acetylmuramic acid kinase [Gammaproteobacteria bacterium]
MSLYIGLMSGTSLDGIDASIVDISPHQVRLKRSVDYPIPAALKQQILTLMNNQGGDNIELLGEVDAKLGIVFAEAAQHLLENSPYQAKDITAIGSHGQTIRHRPDSTTPFTLQIGDASRICELTGITTITDFRRRDIAAGGQGAPLVPAFHRAVFASADENRCIINIGGMANISYLPKNGHQDTAGFDTGPGNVLLDSWCYQQTGEYYDKNGSWGKSGKSSDALLQKMLQDPYFSQAPPKSTGREHFNLDWIDKKLAGNAFEARDVQASLTELTARTIIDAIDNHFADSSQLIICGGGVYNLHLKERLQQLSGQRLVCDTSAYGIDPNWVEAAAFGWLAHCCLNKIPANEPAVTGARSRVILGAIYPK